MKKRTNIGDKGAALFGNAIIKLKSLKNLTLTLYRFSYWFIKIINIFSERNNISQEGALVLGEGLEKIKNLKKVAIDLS